MVFIVQGLLAYVSTLGTTFALYPYRDYVKGFTVANCRNINIAQYSSVRYRGMLRNFQQPLIIAIPFGLLYTGFLAFSGGIWGVLLGGSLFGVSKVAVNSASRRFALGPGKYTPKRRQYSSVSEMIRFSSTQFGVLSFFCGATAASLIAVLWHGLTLASLQRYDSPQSTWGQNFLMAFRAHASLTFMTNPLRNTLRSGMYQQERPGGVRTLSSFVSCERQVFQEGLSVFRAALRTEGISFFLNGVLRTTFKTSLPFAVSYTVFRSMGGSLGGAHRKQNHAHHNHHHRMLRSFH